LALNPLAGDRYRRAVTLESERVERSHRSQLACANAEDWWTELAAARGHAMIKRRGYLWVPGSLRSGLRVMVLRPDLDPAEAAEISLLAASWPGHSITVEDPFSTLDLTGIGLRPGHQPVLVREPGPIEGTGRVQAGPVTSETEVGVVEKTIVEAFPMNRYQPYQQGECFPFSLAGRPGVTFHLARRDGVAAGACATFSDGTAGGVYWVGTQPEHRSQGVGRALMISALRAIGPDIPATLTATAAGQPLYESLGFRAVSESTWWWPAR
jgi:GNAT superfamily N-acetyltransferase